jgi:hypothetical protein
MRRFIHHLLALCLVVVLSAVVVQAQESAQITGRVTDPTGAVIPNAKVTARNNATGTTSSTVTNSAGLYTLPGLASGTYTLTVTAKGFSTYRASDLVLNVAATLQQNAMMKVGASSQTVMVQANALQPQTQSNEVTTLISGKQVNQIATNGRNVTALTTLGTGASGNLPSFNGVAAQSSNANISFNGARPGHNIWMVDGGEIYDRGSGGKPDLLPSPDAISQFQLLSSNYPPDYGLGSGGTILISLKSGTKKFHGGLWEFNRNDALDAGYYFFKKNHIASPELRLNIFGGNIGGPVWIPHVFNKNKNKLFFFVNEEWRRFIAGASPSVVNTVPADDFPTAGQPLHYTPFANGPVPVVPVTSDPNKLAEYAADNLTPGQPFPNNTIPANLLDANAVRFMGTGAIPKPNVGSDQYVASPKQPTYVREDVVRIDENISSKYKLMGSWIHDSMSQTIFPTQWSGASYTTVGDVFSNPSWAGAIRLTQALSPSILNETGFYINGNQINITPAGIYKQPSGWDAKSFFTGNNALDRLPQVAFSGGPLNTTYTMASWPWHNSFLDYQFRDDLTLTHGKHNFKFGFSYERLVKDQQLFGSTQGNYGFDGSHFSHDSYVNFLLGFASTYDQLESQRIDKWRANMISFYGMDNWHVTPRLTVQLGLRDDIMPHTYEMNNEVANFVPSAYKASDAQSPDPNTGDLSPTGPGIQIIGGHPFYMNGIKLPGVDGYPRGLVKNDYATVQPRIGFAYDLSGDGTTVLRGGSGIFYEKVQGNDIYNLGTTPPFAYDPSVNNVYFSDPSVSAVTGQSAAVPLGPAALTNLRYYYPHPGTVQFSLDIQHQVAPNVLAFIGYLGTRSWNQNAERGINVLPLNAMAEREAVATGSGNANLYRPYLGYSNILQEENATNSSYDSLQAELRTTSWHHMTLQFAYTWSHEIDVGSFDLGGATSDPYSYKYDKGSGALDRRNIFNANYIWDIPFFMKSHSVLERTLLAHWVLSGVTTAQSGTPVNVVYNGPNTLGLGGDTSNRPNLDAMVTYPKKQTEWFNTSVFSAPVAPWVNPSNGNEGFGSARKDSVVGPGLFNWNLSLFKTFQFTSNPTGPHLQFRAASFNTFNHTEWNAVDTGFEDSNFGQVTSTYAPRVFQLGMKLMF